MPLTSDSVPDACDDWGHDSAVTHTSVAPTATSTNNGMMSLVFMVFFSSCFLTERAYRPKSLRIIDTFNGWLWHERLLIQTFGQRSNALATAPLASLAWVRPTPRRRGIALGSRGETFGKKPNTESDQRIPLELRAKTLAPIH